MENVKAAQKVADTNVSIINLGLNQYHIHQAHWTTIWSIPNAFRINDHFIMTKLPSGATREKILHVLPEIIADHVGRIHVYQDRHLSVIEVLNPELLRTFLKDHDSIHMESGSSVLVSPAYLIVALPKTSNIEAFASNRFEDKDELKYSLR